MTRKSKDPAGACASCRKEIPLVPDSQGDLVLREHHVVVAEDHRNGYDVRRCAGSFAAPAALDDSKDWAWVPEPQPAREASGPVAVGEAIARMTEAVSDAARATRETFTLSTEQMADAAVRNSAAGREVLTASTVGMCSSSFDGHYCGTLGRHNFHHCVIPGCRCTWMDIQEATHGTE